MIDLDAWLNLTKEDALEPDLAICDPHHHLWDGPGDRGRYLLEEYLGDAACGHNIVRTMFVECGTMYREEGPPEMRPVGETEFAEGIASRSAVGNCSGKSVASGIIGFADLTLGSGVAPVIEAHMRAGRGRLRGIRQSCTWDEDRSVISMGKGKGMMAGAEFREGFAGLGEHGLSFDAWQYYTQLTELAELAGMFPETRIIVNHAGGPLGTGRHAGRRDEVFNEWKEGIAELASCPNVFVKLGGLGMPRCGFGWHERAKPPDSTELAEVMAPYCSYCIEKFTPERCMFESNFPVDRVSYSYNVMWNAFKKISRGYSSKERAALFHDTAAGVYRLMDDNGL